MPQSSGAQPAAFAAVLAPAVVGAVVVVVVFGVVIAIGQVREGFVPLEPVERNLERQSVPYVEAELVTGRHSVWVVVQRCAEPALLTSVENALAELRDVVAVVVDADAVVDAVTGFVAGVVIDEAADAATGVVVVGVAVDVGIDSVFDVAVVVENCSIAFATCVSGVSSF